MKSGVRVLGHSVHPILIVFPLGLLSTAVLFDMIFYFTSDMTFAVVSYWMIIGGLIGGVVAAIFGLLDWLAIPAGTRAKAIGLYHAIANAFVMVLFTGSLYARSGLTVEPTAPAGILAVLGFAVALVGGWLGGELVERLGIAVHEGANPNAPNSLQTENVASADLRGAEVRVSRR